MLKVLAWDIFVLRFDTGCSLAFGFLISNTFTTFVAVYYFSATIWSVKLQQLHFYVVLEYPFVDILKGNNK